MNTAVILHSIADAQYLAANKLHEGCLIFSTHSAAHVYLKEYYGISCQCISKYLTVEEMWVNRELISERTHKILDILDAVVSPEINKRFNLKMSYFNALYSYGGNHQYGAYLHFVTAVERIIAQYNLTKLIFFNYRFNTFLDTKTDMRFISDYFFKDIETEIIEAPRSDRTVHKYRHLITILKRLIKNPLIVRTKLKDMAKRLIRRSPNSSRALLLYDELYELEFIRNEPLKYNIINYSTENKPRGVAMKRLVNEFDISYENVNITNNQFDLALFKDIRDDFSKNIASYINSVLNLQKIREKQEIAAGIWGGSPWYKTKAIIIEYLRSEGIPVIGAQHGCQYGEAIDPWHYESDWSRCDYFISYGFDRGDLMKMYPEMAPLPEILPYGKVNFPSTNKRKRPIDILFPITNTVSILEGGIFRTPADLLTERQTDILRYLNSLNGLSIYIKPLVNSNHNNLAVMPILKGLKNLKIVSDVMLSEFLEQYHPRAVVIEMASQPLVEVIHLDTEIFLMNNHGAPYEKDSLEELKRRVHYSESTEDTIQSISLFIEGRLEKRRDSSFSGHHVYRQGTRDNIIKFINAIPANNLP